MYPRKSNRSCRACRMLVFFSWSVRLIEAEFRLVLRLAIQLVPQVPDFIRRCQAHRQSPLLSSFPSSPEARGFPPPAGRDPATTPGLPYRPQTTFLGCCAHYPGGPIRADGYRLSALPGRVSSGLARPSPLKRRVGTTLRLSRPAPASLALRPAKLLAHLPIQVGPSLTGNLPPFRAHA